MKLKKEKVQEQNVVQEVNNGTDYSEYNMTFPEKVLYALIGGGCLFLVGYVFYQNVWISAVFSLLGLKYPSMRKKQIMEPEAFAREVLAQDTAYDLYLISSRELTSYDLKENGEFYPLNEVEGVQEYLDACFPYVKEAAINEEGDIWMIPVVLTIPGLVYNKAFCAKNGVDFTQMNLAEFIDFTAETKEENIEYGTISGLVLRETLFGQYMTKYNTFDTALLREHVKQFREVKARYWGLSNYIAMQARNNIGMRRDVIPNFYYSCIVYQSNMALYLDLVGASNYFGVVPVPKIEEDMKNMGTVTFMMVNPNSENLEDTLQYISDFAKAMLKEKDSFMLADESI